MTYPDIIAKEIHAEGWSYGTVSLVQNGRQMERSGSDRNGVLPKSPQLSLKHTIDLASTPVL